MVKVKDLAMRAMKVFEQMPDWDRSYRDALLQDLEDAFSKGDAWQAQYGYPVDSSDKEHFVPGNQVVALSSGTVILMGKPYPTGVMLETFNLDMATEAAQKGLRVRDHCLEGPNKQRTSWWSIYTGEMKK